MKSLILTVLYLAKDTVHRWLTRLSSPVARVLVVFFLTLCALCFLGTYVISTKVLQDRIRQQGGDLVHMSMSDPEGRRGYLPTPRELDTLLDADAIVLRTIGMVRTENNRHAIACTYDFSSTGQIFPLLGPGGMPTLFVREDSGLSVGPSHVELEGERVDVCVRPIPHGHLLGKIIEKRDTLLVQPDYPLAAAVLEQMNFGSQTLLLRVRDTSSSEGVRRAVKFCEHYLKLEGVQGHVNSALSLLMEMDCVLSNQMQCRAAFCAGISCIVGILLTALAGMEYRQNEYIYTLMKSFGIHPLLLVGSFIMENLVLVAASFAAAVWVFMRSQQFIVRQFFQVGDYALELQEIMPELQLIALALLGCVLVSSIPIIFAANRDIGRVLK